MVTKEDLPLDFITTFISKGWDEVGIIKASIASIKEAYKNTNKIEAILNDWLDSYLITLGQLEAYTQNEDLIDYPEEFEGVNTDKDDVEVEVPQDVTEVTFEKENTEEPAVDSLVVEPKEEAELFEYLADFDDIEISPEPLTEEDLH